MYNLLRHCQGNCKDRDSNCWLFILFHWCVTKPWDLRSIFSFDVDQNLSVKLSTVSESQNFQRFIDSIVLTDDAEIEVAKGKCYKNFLWL